MISWVLKTTYSFWQLGSRFFLLVLSEAQEVNQWSINRTLIPFRCNNMFNATFNSYSIIVLDGGFHRRWKLIYYASVAFSITEENADSLNLHTTDYLRANSVQGAFYFNAWSNLWIRCYLLHPFSDMALHFAVSWIINVLNRSKNIVISNYNRFILRSRKMAER